MKKVLYLFPFLVSSVLVAQTTTYNVTASGRYGSTQQYVVPACVTEVEIEGFGAQGGNSNGGLGAQIKGRFSVAGGDTLFIVVGQQGSVNTCGGPGASAGGGGGTFVWKSNGPGRTLFLAAGGGGGGNMNWSGSCMNGINAVAVNNGTQGAGPTSGMGGTGGNGGFGNGPSGTGSGGAGWLTSGQNSTYGSGCTGGLTYPSFDGGSGSTTFGSPGEGDGGFGGGGGAVCGNGGGGGYSGGGGGEGSSCRAGGGGGGSYNIGTSQLNTGGVRSGNGIVTVTVTNGTSFTVGATISPNATVCAGTMVTVNGTNGTTYTWDNSITNGVPFMATSSLAMQVIATNSLGCIDTGIFMLTVNPLPTVGYSANPGSAVCIGTQVTLNGTGASSYSWSGGITNGVPFNATTSTTYTVTGTDVNGCSSTGTANLLVNNLPTVGFTASQDTVCAGTAITLSGNGATSYSWSGGVIDGSSFVPATSASYIVTGTDANGCSNTDTVQIVVNPNPVVNLGADITQVNPPVVLDAGAGFSSYLWNTTATTQTISVSTTGNYFVTVTDANGCSNSDTIQVAFTVGMGVSAIGTGTVLFFPNPSSGILNLQIENLISTTTEMTITDMNGRLVFSENLGKVDGNFKKEFDFSGLSAGNYLLTIKADGQKSTQPWNKK